MGKERFVESAKAGYEATKKLTKTKSFATALGVVGGLSGAGLGQSIVDGDARRTIASAIVFAIDVGIITAIVVSSKDSKSTHRQSNSPK